MKSKKEFQFNLDFWIHMCYTIYNERRYNVKEMEELYIAFSAIEKKRNELLEQQSKMDLQEQDLLHYLELQNCDAVQMVKVASKLRSITQERRIVKNQFAEIQPVYTLLKCRIGNWKKHKDPSFYKVRTNVLEETLGIESKIM